MNPAPIPWIACGPGCPPEITGDSGRLHREHLQMPAIRAFSTCGHAGDVAAGAHAGDDARSIGASAEVRQYFLRRGAGTWTVDVGGILELLGDPGASSVCADQFQRALDRALHALLARV